VLVASDGINIHQARIAQDKGLRRHSSIVGPKWLNLYVHCAYTRTMAENRDSESKVPKNGRLGLRTNDRQRSMLAAASRAEGSTVSEFVLKYATRAAEDVLADRRAFVLAESHWAAFTNVLDRPPRDFARLRALIEAPTSFDEHE
jgi:uncharacterized protein (DUF1778 family)